MKARGLTYKPGNIKSAFAATGIWPLNERRVLDLGRSETRGTVPHKPTPSRFHRVIPATPVHGRAILIHGRRLMKALPRQTPHSKYCHSMVEKLHKAAAKATADNVILTIENQNLRKKATSAEDRVKTRSRKELSKAQVIEVEDVVRIREKQEEKERAAAERKERAALKQAQAPPPKLRAAKPKRATTPSPRIPQTPNKRQTKAKKVVFDDSPISIDSDGSEWAGIDAEWEDDDLEDRFDGAEDSILVQPAPQTLRRTTRSQA